MITNHFSLCHVLKTTIGSGSWLPVPLTSSCFPLTHSSPASLASLAFQTWEHSCPRTFALALLSIRVRPSLTFPVRFLISFPTLLKCHLIRENFLALLSKIIPLLPSTYSALLFFTDVTHTHRHPDIILYTYWLDYQLHIYWGQELCLLLGFPGPGNMPGA